MTNLFKKLASLSPMATMSHVEFQQSMLDIQKIGRDHQAKGKPRIGHFERRNGTTRATTVGTKGSRRENNASIKEFIRYLEAYPDRFSPGKAQQALSGFKAVKGVNDIDMVFLAQDVQGLVPLEVQAFDFVGVRKNVREESNKLWIAAHQVAKGASPEVSFVSPAQAQANEQALKDQVVDSGRKFARACLPGAGQRHPKDAKRLAKALNKELGGSDLTRSIGVERLAGLVEEGERRLAAQRNELDALLAQKDTRDQDPAFHAEVQTLGEKIMKSQSSYLHTMALVANRLSDRDLRQLPPDFSLVTARFAQDLVDFLRAQLAPGSLFMQTNRLAADSKASAQRRVAEPKTKPTMTSAPLEIPATYHDEAAFAEEVDRMEAELLAELAQSFPSSMPLPEAKQPGWLAALPPDESQQLTKPIRSPQHLNRQQDSFLSSDDAKAFDEMLGRMDVANVSLATRGGRHSSDSEESFELPFNAEGEKRSDEGPSWRLAARPYDDPSRTNRLAVGREFNAVRMDKAADAFTKDWAHFVKTCLVPADGLHGLSDPQRLVKNWWAGVLPKTSYDPATHHADADMPLAYLDPASLAEVFVTEWPRNLEARRQELKDLLLLKDRLKGRAADVHQQLNGRIQQAANSLERDLVRYLAQVDALAKSLMDRKAFPVNVPAGFRLAASEAGKSLTALSEALRAPMARAHRLIQDARERSAVAR